ncbi:hypothetical protein R0135_03180 [Congregibacter variabilis]|uniref:Uncharacterized protein n=1 Tax=Congregibacter variabilis TaxID=3081200 RepID=A0ABZ0I601_9GAMM|nr:hypothetical protein R0135_03180 [Congregibacter sp. IMCC43200]
MSSTIEFILLVVGIFLGFQFDRWNEGRLQQQEANEYSIQLLDDMSIELQDIEMQMNYHEQVLAFGMTALTAWQEAQDVSAEELVIAFYQASNVTPRASVRGSYDALSSKGLMGLVGGPEFGSKVSAYYSQDLNSLVADVPYRMEVRGVLPNSVQQAVRANCSRLVGSGLLVEELSDDCTIDISAEEAEKVLSELRTHPRLQFYLRQSISKDSVGRYVLESKRESLELLRAELQTIHDARR